MKETHSCFIHNYNSQQTWIKKDKKVKKNLNIWQLSWLQLLTLVLTLYELLTVALFPDMSSCIVFFCWLLYLSLSPDFWILPCFPICLLSDHCLCIPTLTLFHVLDSFAYCECKAFYLHLQLSLLPDNSKVFLPCSSSPFTVSTL